jgi:hypothetical protein
MKRFVYFYYGGRPHESPEVAKASMAEWMAYFQKLGSHNGDGGSPLGASRSVGGKMGASPSGFSIIHADTLDQAVALTKGHPRLEAGGTIQVCETLLVPT